MKTTKKEPIDNEEFWDERITKEDIEFAVRCEEEKWEMYNYDKGV